MDEERLRSERADRKSWKSRVTGIEEFGPVNTGGAAGGRGYHSDGEASRPRRSRGTRGTEDDNDLEMRLAIEASKNEAEEDAKRRARLAGHVDDDDLEKAIKLSKEEEELRRRELEESNAASLFDDTPSQQPQQTGFNQGYQQQATVDWFGNPMDAQQPQQTGFMGMQQTGFPAQQTGYQNGFGYGYQQPQQTGYEAFAQQQTGYLQAQQTAFNMNNPYGQAAGQGFGNFQQQPVEQQNTLQPGSHNPWSANQQQQQESLMPQPTGSNNPFASGFGRPQTAQPARQQPPTLSSLAEQRTTTNFGTNSFQQQPQPQQPAFTAQPAALPPPPQKPEDPHTARLNALLASGEGQDTFGNVGNLRIPAQHTAPGTFVNSAGAGVNRLTANATGTNPFMNSQFTGMPAQNRMMPAQTGPVGGAGGTTNPFGGQRPQGGNSGSLIDL